jgi:hypothetical protein
MWAHAFGQSRGYGVGFDDRPEPDSRQRPASLGHEDLGDVPTTREQTFAIASQIFLEGVSGSAAKRDESLFVSFADTTSEASDKVEIAHTQSSDFGCSATRGVKRLQRSSVATAQGQFGIGSIQ